MRLGALLIRATLGPLFIGHGTQKLFGWFGGHGLEATGNAFESMGLRPGRRHATAAGLAEAVGGALLTVGAATPLAASVITGTMITAIRKVHAPNGPWVTQQGYEYNAVIIAAMAAMADHGAGPLSVDSRLMPRVRGPVVAALALGAGAAGSYLATEVFNESEPAPQAFSAATGDAPADDAPAEDRERETIASAG